MVKSRSVPARKGHLPTTQGKPLPSAMATAMKSFPSPLAAVLANAYRHRPQTYIFGIVALPVVAATGGGPISGVSGCRYHFFRRAALGATSSPDSGTKSRGVRSKSRSHRLMSFDAFIPM